MKTVQYKCPNCGGNLEFKIDKQGFGCEYCLSFFTESEIKEIFDKNESEKLDENENEELAKKKQEFETHSRLYSCSNCGAKIISEDTTAATFCYYCQNPVILLGRLSGEYKPDKIIAFKIDEDNAKNIFKKWCSKKYFLPNEFGSNKQLEKMSGVYVPFWIVDCDIKANVIALGKKIRRWESDDMIHTETKEYELVRRADIYMNGIPADGAKKIEDSLMEAIEPFDYNELKDFSMSYLSGFFADKYDVDKKDIFPRIKNRAVDGCDRLIRSTMKGYDSISIINSEINIMKTDWKYMLLPVWFMTYKYKDETYSIAINGQTGKIAGRLPLNLKKLYGFLFGLVALITAIYVIWGYLSW